MPNKRHSSLTAGNVVEGLAWGFATIAGAYGLMKMSQPDKRPSAPGRARVDKYGTPSKRGKRHHRYVDLGCSQPKAFLALPRAVVGGNA